MRFHMFHSAFERIIISVSFQNHFYPFTAEHLGLFHLLFWRCTGHIDHAFHLQLITGKSNALSMVTCAGANNPFFKLLFWKAGNLIIRPSNLVRSNLLQVLSFQHDIRLESF